MDRISKSRRSWNMAQIKSRDTTPERTVRSALHRLGYRFRLGDHGLPGRPDLVLPRLGLAVFVHGCFWHRHRNCQYAYDPESNRAFWRRKFAANIRRDATVQRELLRLGWTPIVIWECQTQDPDRLPILLKSRLPHRAN